MQQAVTDQHYERGYRAGYDRAADEKDQEQTHLRQQLKEIRSTLRAYRKSNYQVYLGALLDDFGNEQPSGEGPFFIGPITRNSVTELARLVDTIEKTSNKRTKCASAKR